MYEGRFIYVSETCEGGGSNGNFCVSQIQPNSDPVKLLRRGLSTFHRTSRISLEVPSVCNIILRNKKLLLDSSRRRTIVGNRFRITLVLTSQQKCRRIILLIIIDPYINLYFNLYLILLSFPSGKSR